MKGSEPGGAGGEPLAVAPGREGRGDPAGAPRGPHSAALPCSILGRSRVERYKETAPRMLCLRLGHREEGEEAASSLGAGIWLLKWDSPLQTQGTCWRGAGKPRRLHEGPWVRQGRGLDAAPHSPAAPETPCHTPGPGGWSAPAAALPAAGQSGERGHRGV